MKSFLKVAALTCLLSLSASGDVSVDPSQGEWFQKYKKQQNIPEVSEMLLNSDAEPNLSEGFEDLFNGKDLSDWEIRGGKQLFEAKDGVIIGTCVPGETSGYLSTKKEDYGDFIFTCEIKWEVDLNTGVMFRAQSGEKGTKKSVFGPQVEMEGVRNTRGWSGGIYGQSCGGYFYPLWLKGHAEVRKSLKKEGWNRVTVLAKGTTVKTWVNGVPASHWVGDGTYAKGYFGLQVHKAKKGKVRFRNLKVKELDDQQTLLNELDAYWAEVSRSVKSGDFEGYKATCHEKAVLVSEKKETSYPLSQALVQWKPGIDATKAGEMEADVKFRFSKRWGDDITAHETGMFCYSSKKKGEEAKVVYVHLEALLVKEGRWLVMMEYQRAVGTKEEWEKLK